MNEHLRNLIHRHRAAKGLNFGQLAELSGYKNRSKWAIKINFERVGVGTDELVGKVIQGQAVWRQSFTRNNGHISSYGTTGNITIAATFSTLYG